MSTLSWFFWNFKRNVPFRLLEIAIAFIAVGLLLMSSLPSDVVVVYSDMRMKKNAVLASSNLDWFTHLSVLSG